MDTVTPHWPIATGASIEALERLRQEIPGLPPQYLKCLAIGNGGEVALRVSPYNFCLDSAESALDYWLSGAYSKQSVFIFGGNGSSTVLAFELGLTDQWPVICFDPISPDDSIELVAASFEELLKLCEQ